MQWNGMGMEWGWNAIWDTWRQMTEFTLQPKDAETAWEASPRGLKRAEKEERRDVRGRSSLTTTHMRTHDKLIPLDCGREEVGKTTYSKQAQEKLDDG